MKPKQFVENISIRLYEHQPNKYTFSEIVNIFKF